MDVQQTLHDITSVGKEDYSQRGMWCGEKNLKSKLEKLSESHEAINMLAGINCHSLQNRFFSGKNTARFLARFGLICNMSAFNRDPEIQPTIR